ncbi:MAG: efflux RND transporter periplasmic adaptor subunit [Flavobacteriaceae bacterium]|nr:efflux RND transporter periplasmic adaptor subunit [Flavobacteriaceae bacterium]MCF8425731.1 efflux RND transporter periplasmic adaptor subunit [Bacteroidia bacterium]MCF8446397.1 efflux RND transporter periplasmic adaptor subunit [Bacteroidia bacterium]
MKKIINGLVLILFVGVIASCGGDALQKKKDKLEKLKTKQAEIISEIKTMEEEILALGDTSSNKNERMKYVVVTQIQRTNFNHYIDVQGRVDGDQNTTISARAMGPVVKVYVKSGASVKKDQILAELDAEIVRRQIDDLKVSLNFATDVFNKQKALWEKQVGTEIQYLSAKNNMESLQQKLATLNENLDMYKIKSPINGTVDEVFVKIGQNIAPGVPCFRVVNFNNLKAKADVAETYASKIHEGNQTKLLFPDLNNRELNSTISFTSRVINQQNRTFTIEAYLPAEKDFFPNMICVFKVMDYQAKNAIVVPVNTIQKTDGIAHLIVAEMKNGRQVAIKKEVVVGQIYNDKAEILSGLSEGDQLITTGFQDLNDNELVKY